METEDKTYNGWKNYETWLVGLWIDNDKGSSDFWRERANDIFKHAEAEGHFTKFENARLALMDELKNSFDSQKDDLFEDQECSGFWNDLVRAALDEVSWYELANNYLLEVAPEEAEKQ